MGISPVAHGEEVFAAGILQTRSSVIRCSHQTTVLAAAVNFRHAQANSLTFVTAEDGYNPFVPDLTIIRLAPHGDLDLGLIGDVQRCL